MLRTLLVKRSNKNWVCVQKNYTVTVYTYRAELWAYFWELIFRYQPIWTLIQTNTFTEQNRLSPLVGLHWPKSNWGIIHFTPWESSAMSSFHDWKNRLKFKSLYGFMTCYTWLIFNIQEKMWILYSSLVSPWKPVHPFYWQCTFPCKLPPPAIQFSSPLGYNMQVLVAFIRSS